MVSGSQSLRRNLLLAKEFMTEKAGVQKRCDRNRKRSKRRAIYCPVHNCLLHSVSPKYPLYADQVTQLQERGMGRRTAALLVATKTTVPLTGEWIEAFWCEHCQSRQWYHVCKRAYPGEGTTSHPIYELSLAPAHLWQQAVGVIQPHGNPSVGEFTCRQARMRGFGGIKDFGFAS